MSNQIFNLIIAMLLTLLFLSRKSNSRPCIATATTNKWKFLSAAFDIRAMISEMMVLGETCEPTAAKRECTRGFLNIFQPVISTPRSFRTTERNTTGLVPASSSIDPDARQPLRRRTLHGIAGSATTIGSEPPTAPDILPLSLISDGRGNEQGP